MQVVKKEVSGGFGAVVIDCEGGILIAWYCTVSAWRVHDTELCCAGLSSKGSAGQQRSVTHATLFCEDMLDGRGGRG